MQNRSPVRRRTLLGAGAASLLAMQKPSLAQPAWLTPVTNYLLDDNDIPPSFQYPFKAGSYSKQKIPQNPTFRSENDSMTERLRQKTGQMVPNYYRFCSWLYTASASDPLRTFHVDPLHAGQASQNPGPVTIRIPATANPDPGRNYWPYFPASGNTPGFGSQTSDKPWDPRQGEGNPTGAKGDINHNYDGHISILDPDGRTLHDFYHAWQDPETGIYYAVSYTRLDIFDHDGFFISGAGCTRDFGREYPGDMSSNTPPIPGRPRTLGWGSTRAGGCSSAVLAIRKDELLNPDPSWRGPEHALAFLFHKEHQYYDGNFVNSTEGSATVPANFRRPCSRPDTDGDDVISANLPASSRFQHGQRFAIPRGLTPSQVGVSTLAGRRLLYALQEYGGYNVDQGGLPGPGGMFTITFDGANAGSDGAALSTQELSNMKSRLLPVEDKPVAV